MLESIRRPRRRRLLTAVAVSVVGAGVLAACGQEEAPAATGSCSGDQVEVRYALGIRPVPVASAYYSSLPDTLGYFTDECLNVQAQPVAGGNEAVQLLTTGQADITMTASNTVVAAVDTGMEAKAFCSMLQRPNTKMAVLADSSIEDIDGFRGQTIGVPTIASASTTLLRTMLTSAGINPDTDVSIIPIGDGPQAVAAIRQGEMKAFANSDIQFAALETQGLKFRYISTPEADALTFNQVLTVSDAFAEQHPDVAARFGRAVARASLFAQKFPEEAIKLHWKVYPETRPQGMDEDAAVESAQHQFRTRIGNTRLVDGARWCEATDESVEKTVAFVLSSGAGNSGAIDASKYWTSEYIDEINDFSESDVTLP